MRNRLEASESKGNGEATGVRRAQYSVRDTFIESTSHIIDLRASHIVSILVLLSYFVYTSK